MEENSINDIKKPHTINSLHFLYSLMKSDDVLLDFKILIN